MDFDYDSGDDEAPPAAAAAAAVSVKPASSSISSASKGPIVIHARGPTATSKANGANGTTKKIIGDHTTSSSTSSNSLVGGKNDQLLPGRKEVLSSAAASQGVQGSTAAPSSPSSFPQEIQAVQQFYRRRLQVYGAEQLEAKTIESRNTAAEIILLIKSEMPKPEFTLELKCQALIRLHFLSPLQLRREYAEHNSVVLLVGNILRELRAYSNMLEAFHHAVNVGGAPGKTSAAAKTDDAVPPLELSSASSSSSTALLVETTSTTTTSPSTTLKARPAKGPIDINGHPDLLSIVEALYVVLSFHIPAEKYITAIQALCAKIDVRQMLACRKIGFHGVASTRVPGLSLSLAKLLPRGAAAAYQVAPLKYEQQRAERTVPLLAYCSGRPRHVRTAVALLNSCPQDRLCVLSTVLHKVEETDPLDLADAADASTSSAPPAALAITDVKDEDTDDFEKKDVSSTTSSSSKQVLALQLRHKEEEERSPVKGGAAGVTCHAEALARVEEVVAVHHGWSTVRLELLVLLILALPDDFLAEQDADAMLATAVRLYEETVQYLMNNPRAAVNATQLQIDTQAQKLEQQRRDAAASGKDSNGDGYKSKPAVQRLRPANMPSYGWTNNPKNLKPEQHIPLEKLPPLSRADLIENLLLGFHYKLDRQIEWARDVQRKLFRARNVTTLDDLKDTLHEDRVIKQGASEMKMGGGSLKKRKIVRTVQVMDHQAGHAIKKRGNDRNRVSPARLCADFRGSSF
ncbi:unnamed protein product [Amoebophrya sp. A25]|nr:unnamed protein product [Amoebophrya sp. A25]|eukprot:GSA25T00026142001.1